MFGDTRKDKYRRDDIFQTTFDYVQTSSKNDEKSGSLLFFFERGI